MSVSINWGKGKTSRVILDLDEGRYVLSIDTEKIKSWDPKIITYHKAGNKCFIVHGEQEHEIFFKKPGTVLADWEVEAGPPARFAKGQEKNLSKGKEKEEGSSTRFTSGHGKDLFPKGKIAVTKNGKPTLMSFERPYYINTIKLACSDQKVILYHDLSPKLNTRVSPKVEVDLVSGVARFDTIRCKSVSIYLTGDRKQVQFGVDKVEIGSNLA